MRKLLLLSVALVFISLTPSAFAQYCNTIVTVSVSPSSIFSGESITISGRVSASYPCRLDPPVQLYLDGSYIATTNTDPSGYYSYVYSASLSSGTHTIRAVSRIDSCREGSASATFTVYSACEAKYLDVWQCSGNWRQRQYQNSDCSLVWQNYEYCDNGCSGGYCLSAPSCVQPCQPCYYPCLVSPQIPCLVSVSVTTPKDLYFGETIYSTVQITNSGDVGGNVNFAAYVCRADGTNCQMMNCDGFDPYVYIPGHSTRSFVCWKKANDLSWHKIKIDYSGCNVDPTIYSATFHVKPYPTCAAGYLNNFQCLGNWKQQLYQFADCRTEWRNVLYCNYGCSAGQCSEAPKQGYPEILAEPEYTVYRCERNKLTFDVSNQGEARDTFDIAFSGSAARWVRSVSSVSLAPQEIRTITAYASIPCSAEGGDYDLTISVKDGKNSTYTTILTVAGLELLPFTGWSTLLRAISYILLFLVLAGLVLLLLLLLARGLPKKKASPEEFMKGKSFVRKKPESFSNRECYYRKVFKSKGL